MTTSSKPGSGAWPVEFVFICLEIVIQKDLKDMISNVLKDKNSKKSRRIQNTNTEVGTHQV
jgi:hypothetical protein